MAGASRSSRTSEASGSCRAGSSSAARPRKPCLVREIREELGVTATPGPLLDVWLHRVRPDTPETEVVIVTYGCRAEPFDEIHWTAEHRGGLLASLDELARLPMPEGYRRSIRTWAATPGG